MVLGCSVGVERTLLGLSGIFIDPSHFCFNLFYCLPSVDPVLKGHLVLGHNFRFLAKLRPEIQVEIFRVLIDFLLFYFLLDLSDSVIPFSHLLVHTEVQVRGVTF